MFFVIFQTSDAQYLRTAMIMVFAMRKHGNVIAMITGIVWKIVQVNYFLINLSESVIRETVEISFQNKTSNQIFLLLMVTFIAMAITIKT